MAGRKADFRAVVYMDMDSDLPQNNPPSPGGPDEADRGAQPFDGLLTIPIATALVGADGRILHWSPDAEALLGYGPDEAIGARAADLLITDEQRSAVLDLFSHIVQGNAWSGVFPVRHRAGHQVDLEFRTYPVKGPGGHPLVLAVASDVTALRQLQADLAVLDGFFNQSPVGMAVYDTQLRFVRLNPSLAEINGVPVEEHLGRRVTELLPGINGEEVEAVMRQVLRDGEGVLDTRSHGRTPGDPEHDHAWSAAYFRLERPDGQILGVSSTLVDITPRYTAEQQATRAQQRLALLAQASAHIGTTLDLHQTAHELTNTMIPELADTVGVFALEQPTPQTAAQPDLQWVRRLSLVTIDPDRPAADLPAETVLWLPPGSAFTQALETGRTVTAPDWELSLLAGAVPADRLRAYRSGSPRPVLVHPLVARGSVLGMLAYSRRAGRGTFTEEDITLGDELASRAAVAIDNAQLYEHLQHTAEAREQALREARQAQERLALVNTASARIGTTLDLATTARELAEVATPRLADTVTVEVLDALARGIKNPATDRSAVLRRLAFHTVPGSKMSPVTPVGAVHCLPPSTPYAWALVHRRPILLPQIDQRTLQWFSEDPIRHTTLSEQGVRSLMVVPLIARGAAVGVASFFRTVTDQPYDEEDLRLAGELAARAAVSIDNALLYTRERDAAEQRQRALDEAEAAQQRLALLNEASTRIGTTLDLYRTGDELINVVIPRFADFVMVAVLESVLEGDEPVALPREQLALVQTLAGGGVEGTEALARAVGPAGAVTRTPRLYADSLRTGRPMLIPEVDETVLRQIVADPNRVGPALDARVHSYLMVPLRARGMVLGGVEFARTTNPQAFTAADVALGEELASRAAVCIDNARLYRRERDTALTLQRSLLPQEVHRTPGLEIAYRYQPSSEISEVGGDWFDVVPLSGGRVALIVGDVMGHGIRAAATMGQLRTVARTLITLDIEPDRVLRRLDEATSALGEGQFATCVCVVFDPVDRVCTASSAGHLPPVLAEPGAPARLLEPPPGTPLGVGGAPFESIRFALPEDGVLVLYTDGLVERRGQDLDDGLDLLCRTVTERDGTLEQACEAVLTALDASSGQDDVAVIMAHSMPLGDDRIATLPLAGDRAMVGHARRFTRWTLQSWGLSTLTDLAELLTSEVITNALVHAGAPLQLRIFRNHVLTVEVSDTESHEPRPRRARSEDEGGRGMHLINELSHRWGSRSTSEGKVVWFELELPPGM